MLVLFDLDTEVGVIFCYAVEAMESCGLIVFFDDRFWSDARVSYQIECCRIEVKSFLVLGGVSNPIVFSARFLIYLAREVLDSMG